MGADLVSKHFGYVCRSHDPELASEMWFNHGTELLIEVFRIERAGLWPNDEWGNPELAGLLQDHPLQSVGPIWWLREHPRCTVALRDEYGDVQEIP